MLGSALFLPAMGVSTFATPEEGQAYLAGIEEFAKLPDTFADTVFALTSLVVIILLFVGNVLLGIAVWRSGTLPRWAGALWAGAAVLMYPFGIVYAATIGVQSTPRTVLVGALLIVVGGRWPCEHCTGPPSGWWASKPSPECNSQPPGDRRVRIHARRHWTTGRGGTSRCKQP
ncbi:MAG TPA: hypothetical protein VKA20_03030 [Rubrobacter sp.]|nr:hypothetical protein [Rubrobacter sp.]